MLLREADKAFSQRVLLMFLWRVAGVSILWGVFITVRERADYENLMAGLRNTVLIRHSCQVDLNRSKIRASGWRLPSGLRYDTSILFSSFFWFFFIYPAIAVAYKCAGEL
jgi:hypothetical protein